MRARARRVAVVEDDPSMRTSVARLLRIHGIDSELYSSAEAFLAGLADSMADCVLADIHLGGLSGIELCRCLKASGRFPRVVVMTALDNKATEKEAINAGCAAYLAKPFSAASLMEAINN